MKKSNVSIQSINAENSGLVLFQPAIHLDYGEFSMDIERLSVHPALQEEIQTILKACQNVQFKDFGEKKDWKEKKKLKIKKRVQRRNKLDFI